MEELSVSNLSFPYHFLRFYQIVSFITDRSGVKIEKIVPHSVFVQNWRWNIYFFGWWRRWFFFGLVCCSNRSIVSSVTVSICIATIMMIVVCLWNWFSIFGCCSSPL